MYYILTYNMLALPLAVPKSKPVKKLKSSLQFSANSLSFDAPSRNLESSKYPYKPCITIEL